MNTPLSAPKPDTLVYKLQRDIQETVRKHIEEAKEEVVQLAVREFTERVRKIVGSTAITIANMYSIERIGSELVIHVKIEGDSR